MKSYFTPNDEGIIAESDSLSIQNAVDEAIRSDVRKVVIPRINLRTGKAQWDVDKAIVLSSNLEIVLDNCYIRQMDGSMDNVFRNFDDDAMRSTLEEEQENIVIRGVGNAVIDGGIHNGLLQKNSMQNGLPHVEMNNVIRLHNLRGFRLTDFTIINQRWWAINLNYVEEGYIAGLKIKCNNGQHNLDGIDLRSGCNNIILENLFGQAGDDFIALTGFYGGRASDKYAVVGKSIDIHDIQIKNIIATSAECTVVALRNQDGVKIYNVTVDTVYDAISSKEINNDNPNFVFNFDNNAYRSPKSPYALMRIGQEGWIHKKQCEMGDVYGIHVHNIHARTNTAIILNEKIEDSYFGNIYASEGVDKIISTKSCRTHQTYGADMRNVVFENIFYNCKNNENSVAFDFDINGKEHSFENVFIKNAFLGNVKCAVDMKHKGTLNISGLYGENVNDKIKITSDALIILDGHPYN